MPNPVPDDPATRPVYFAPIPLRRYFIDDGRKATGQQREQTAKHARSHFQFRDSLATGDSAGKRAAAHISRQTNEFLHLMPGILPPLIAWLVESSPKGILPHASSGAVCATSKRLRDFKTCQSFPFPCRTFPCCIMSDQ